MSSQGLPKFLFSSVVPWFQSSPLGWELSNLSVPTGLLSWPSDLNYHLASWTLERQTDILHSEYPVLNSFPPPCSMWHISWISVSVKEPTKYDMVRSGGPSTLSWSLPPCIQPISQQVYWSCILSDASTCIFLSIFTVERYSSNFHPW